MSNVKNKRTIPTFDMDVQEVSYEIIRATIRLVRDRSTKHPEQVIPLCLAKTTQEKILQSLDEYSTDCDGITLSDHVHFEYAVHQGRKPYVATITAEIPKESPIEYGPVADAIIELGEKCGLTHLGVRQENVSSISKCNMENKSIELGIESKSDIFESIYEPVRQNK